MKKKRNKKLWLGSIAMLLAVSVLLTAMPPMSSLAKEVATEGEQTTHEAWSPEELQFPNTEGDLPLEELDTAKLLPEDTPEIVSSENIQDKGHVNRLWEQENDLNTIVFQNRDGTKTAYHYSDPVKYTDKSGKVKDKKNKLSETANGEYTNAENDINAYFPKKIHKNKGVELIFGEYTIEMAPNVNGSSGASRQTGHDKDSNPKEYVEYPNVFADGVSVRYTPAFGGYKEDIILSENVGKNRFEFKLTTNGLSLVRAETGNYYLAEPLTGEYITALGNVVVYDNTGVESEGYHHYYEVTTISADEQYLITVVVDERYLESEDTEYPVYVDPTLTVMPKGNVQDAAIYSGGRSFANDNLEVKIGYDAAYGTGRGLYNFPILNFTNDFILMYGNQIVSADLNLYATIYGEDKKSYNDAKTLSLYEFHSEWSSSTVKWNNTNPNNYSTLVSSKSVTTGWTAFDISSVIEQFKSNPDYTVAFKGLLLKADSEVYTTWKKFVSTSGTSTRRPYISITYNDNPTACAQVVSGATYYVKNYSGKYLDVYYGGTTDNTPLWTYEHNGTVAQQFKITYISAGQYEIAPQHTTGKVLSVNSSGQVVIEEDCNLSRQRWYIYYRNGSYHIVNKAYNSGVMAPTYNTDYVSINNEYEYCCWELEHAYREIVSPIWKDTDANYSDAVQTILLEINFQWYFSETNAQRQDCIDRANKVRSDVSSGFLWWLDETKKWTEALANDIGWFLGGSVSTNDRDEWLELNKIFSENISAPTSDWRETAVFILGFVTPSVDDVVESGVRSWIKRATYQEIGDSLGKNASKKFIKAMRNGLVGGTNQQGIKILNSTVGGKFYKYELKILGDFGDWRLVGNLDEASGHIIFEKLVKHSDIGK